MKRLWSTARYRRQQAVRRARRTDREEERRQADREESRRREQRRKGAPKGARVPRRDGRVQVVAPTHLCLFDAPESVLVFWQELRTQTGYRQSRVWVDLRAVEKVAIDGMLILKSAIDEARDSAEVGGNLPTDPNVAATLKASGFFHGFVRPPGQLGDPQGIVRKWSSKSVESPSAAELVQFAMSHAAVSREVGEASYKALVELMSNTYLHSGGRPRDDGKRLAGRWFASV